MGLFRFTWTLSPKASLRKLGLSIAIRLARTFYTFNQFPLSSRSEVTIMQSLPIEYWIAAGLVLFFTATSGFVAGRIHERTAVRRNLRKARKQVSKCFDLVLGSLDAAQDACSRLENFTSLDLNSGQVQHLEKKRSGLLESVSRLLDSYNRQGKEQAVKSSAKNLSDKVEDINWLRSSEDSRTGLPGYIDFKSNLTSLLELVDQTGTDSGLLFVKMDKFDQLKTRFNQEAANKFLTKISQLICRSIRDEDLVCQFSDDTLAVLIPGHHGAAGKKLAESIRKVVRQHHFRLTPESPEVLVTASFGYTTCQPGDHPDLAESRAETALNRSQKRGRNQLHIFDGEELVHCAVS